MGTEQTRDQCRPNMNKTFSYNTCQLETQYVNVDYRSDIARFN